MRRMFAMLLALAMLLTLTACGEAEPQETTQAPQSVEVTEAPKTTEAPAQETEAPTEAPEVETEGPVVEDGLFSFTFNGVQLVPGTVYDAAVLPEPGSVYQVPSCAIEGTDNVYSFDEVEITAFHDGTQELIYAIAIIDPNVTTDEGLYLGDDVARVVELYGENYEENGTAMVYRRTNTMLSIIVQGGFVVDIEYSWITE